MNRCFAFATLSVALVLGTAGNANAFFGLLGGTTMAAVSRAVVVNRAVL